LVDLIQCFDPYYTQCSDDPVPNLIIKCLKYEYGSDIVEYLFNDRFARYRARQHEIKIHEEEVSFRNTQHAWKKIDANWPTIPSIQINLKCMRNYFQGSQWHYGSVCCVCSRKRNAEDFVTSTVTLEEDSKMSCDNLEILRCQDIQLKANFFFPGNETLNGLMLDHRGINSDGSIELCNECLVPLQNLKLPKFALKNNLYRGQLPEEFSDLTWIEEMACCIYRTTAHVVRLYNSSNDKQPRIFHGNVCAHEMNIVSTATELPRTPKDITGSISVVFIGPEKYKSDAIHKLFKIRRDKVWAFLCWLKFTAKNPLYQDIPLSEENLLQYNEVDPDLVGIHQRIIHDNRDNAQQMFEEESAGVDKHPAADLSNTDDGEPVLFLENMGVSDPECDGISGNAATASALRNMFIQPVKDPSQPDLVLHHHGQAVPEYHNPSLFPGMYPTLFPYGVGGFE
ncbi:hypothetical protein R3P38DRAFT_2361923, partial [Favolaschia claudopus]